MRLIPLIVPLCVLAPEPGDKTPTGNKEQVLKRFVDELTPITPGKDRYPPRFRMGSLEAAPEAEKPAHEVTFTKPFAIARYEVTQELYEKVISSDPSKWKGPRNAVEMVSWDDAVAFCKKLTVELHARKLLRDDELIRLPSEAEWEYACRAGTTTQYSFGDDPALLKDHAWFNGNAKGEDPPVGKKKPNPWGIYDMHGYVWEWCQDAWHDNYEKAPTDGRSWDDARIKERVARGGSWADDADNSRSAYRLRLKASEKSDRVGFRCVRASKGDPHGR
jgi:formylglycine-generating enzyme required for sulfatase activity